MKTQIMVVEDERILALHLRQQLVRLGYGILGPTASGEDALRQIETAKPDLVLMDIHIEGMLDGIETAARIPPDYLIPVIYLTAYSEEATLARARRTKPYGYLIKPFSERELHATIQMALERNAAEKALHTSQAALRQAQKMEAIGQLAGGVAHDFNNLLGVIIGNLEVAAEQIAAHTDLAEMVQEALNAALQGAGLTQQLLAYARLQPLSARLLQLNELIPALVGLMRRTLGGKVLIRTQLADKLWKICVDANQLDSALLNLAINARDAMPEGGVLTIAASNIQYGPASVHPVPGMGDGAYVLIAVTDSGSGMSKAVAEKALEPFFTTKPVGKGTGLGLSMVYGFVKQSNGHIVIDSAPGCGTTIYLYLPAVRADCNALDSIQV